MTKGACDFMRYRKTPISSFEKIKIENLIIEMPK